MLPAFKLFIFGARKRGAFGTSVTLTIQIFELKRGIGIREAAAKCYRVFRQFHRSLPPPEKL